MKTKLIAAVLAMAMAVGTPGFAADRPVGPETGQTRTEPGPDAGPGSEPDSPDNGLDPGPTPPGMTGFMPAPDSCWFWWRCN